MSAAPAAGSAVSPSSLSMATATATAAATTPTVTATVESADGAAAAARDAAGAAAAAQRVTLGTVLRTRYNRFAVAANPAVPPPYIPTGSRHYMYALFRLAGCTRADACVEAARFLGLAEPISAETARRWERELRRQAAAWLGVSTAVEYYAAAEIATNQGLWAALQKQVPESGH